MTKEELILEQLEQFLKRYPPKDPKKMAKDIYNFIKDLERKP